MLSRPLKIAFLGVISATTMILVIMLLNQLPSSQHQTNLGQAIAQAVQPGDGLNAQYFSTIRFTGPVLTRIEPNIDFDIAKQRPHPDVPGDFSAIWTGQIQAERDGLHTFYVDVDDEAQLRIDGQLIVDAFKVRVGIYEGTFDMEAGKRYDLEMKFFDDGGVARLRMEWSGPGLSRQIVPQRVLYSTSSQCADKVDNDGDGKIDYPADPGCDNAGDNDETDPLKMACEDGIDNDGDGKIDFPADPGCTSSSDTDETDPPKANCDDSLDNDGDGKIDFPEDPGCSSSSDDDETDPPTTRSVSLSTTSTAVSSAGENLYPLGIRSNFPNNLYAKAKVGNRFEIISMTPVLLPSVASGSQVTNASLNYYLLRGKDSSGKEHLAVIQGRHWDPNTFADPSLTPDPWYSFFASAGDISSCAAEMGQRFSAVPFYLDSPFFFQQMLEMLTLCQFGPSGATPSTPSTP